MGVRDSVVEEKEHVTKTWVGVKVKQVGGSPSMKTMQLRYSCGEKEKTKSGQQGTL